jgi:hypothetical protein
LELDTRYQELLAIEDVYEDFVQLFVGCLTRSLTGVDAVCGKVQTEPLSPTLWRRRRGAPRRFESSAHVWGIGLILRGGFLLNPDSKLLAAAILIKGVPSVNLDKDEVVEDMGSFFDDEMDSKVCQRNGVLSCFISPNMNPNYGILKLPRLNHLFED